MKTSLRLLARFALILALAGLSTAAFAQATRTWVSGVGDDANPCSRTAPCKTFAGAISKTATGGEINILDPGGFGGVTITKSITIQGPTFDGGVLVSGTNAVVINAPGGTVILRDLSFNGLGTGLSGVNILNATSVTIENSTFAGFDTACVNFAPSVSASLDIRDSSFQLCGDAAVSGSGAVVVQPVSPAIAEVTLEGVTVNRSQLGVRIEDRGVVNVRNSTFSNNENAGVTAKSTVGVAIATVTNSEISGIGSQAAHAGVKSSGSGSRVYIGGNDISNNFIGLSSNNAGQIISFGNNTVANNNTNGAPTSTTPQM
jgi:hypothetical protein